MVKKVQVFICLGWVSCNRLVRNASYLNKTRESGPRHSSGSANGLVRTKPSPRMSTFCPKAAIASQPEDGLREESLSLRGPNPLQQVEEV